jgi:hypothetical protein
MASSIPISNGAQQPVPALAQVILALPMGPDERAKSDLWIFREGRREVSGPTMVRELARQLASNDSLLDCLIQSGELESALSDLDAPGALAAASLTDALATILYAGKPGGNPHLQQLALKIQIPDTISISPPEGFTYYALHPLDYARIAERISNESAAFAVIGIRSIGTTLSAVTTAALQAQGRAAARITVRPVGHPYARTTQFCADQQRWIAEQLSQSAQFLLVDEGPGRSGSTFLSVAEALVRVGVPQERITVIGSRVFRAENLCAQDAIERWRGLRFLSTASSVSTRFFDFSYLGNGEWRKYFFTDEEAWPESWTQMERLKFLSADQRQFFKFEGMGPLGRDVRARAFALADAGFSPAVSDAGDGFLAYANVEGRTFRSRDVSDSVLERIAQYCSFRACEFTCAAPCNSEFERMLEFNVHQEFGRELKLNPGQLTSTNPVLADGRMQPYEWIGSTNGELLKTDAIAHGDNHFFPGPCDIAWDLAGAIVEWNLSPEAKEFLLRRFHQRSGIDVSEKVKLYMLAYSVFRLGFCKMAISTVSGSEEEYRLDSAYHRYRTKAAEMLDSLNIP